MVTTEKSNVGDYRSNNTLAIGDRWGGGTTHSFQNSIINGRWIINQDTCLYLFTVYISIVYLLCLQYSSVLYDKSILHAVVIEELYAC